MLWRAVSGWRVADCAPIIGWVGCKARRHVSGGFPVVGGGLVPGRAVGSDWCLVVDGTGSTVFLVSGRVGGQTLSGSGVDVRAARWRRLAGCVVFVHGWFGWLGGGGP